MGTRSPSEHALHESLFNAARVNLIVPKISDSTSDDVAAGHLSQEAARPRTVAFLGGWSYHRPFLETKLVWLRWRGYADVRQTRS